MTFKALFRFHHPLSSADLMTGDKVAWFYFTEFGLGHIAQALFSNRAARAEAATRGVDWPGKAHRLRG